MALKEAYFESPDDYRRNMWHEIIFEKWFSAVFSGMVQALEYTSTYQSKRQLL
jgi:hypothetical protein